MSDEKKTPGDDDGWGAAADGWNAQAGDETNEGAAGPSPEDTLGDDEWVDPVNLEERVAALHSQPATISDEIAVEDADEASAAEDPDEASAAEDPDEASAAEDPDEASAVEDPDEASAVEDPDEASAVEEEPEELSSDRESQEPHEDEARAVAPVDDEDAPQWAATPVATDPRTTATIAAPSSDMLAAAEAVAKRTSESRPRESPPSGAVAKFGLTRKQLTRLVAGGVLLVLAAVVAIMGWFNSKNYYLVCGAKSIRAEQGRFWPTGKSSLSGAAFHPIAVPSDALCQGKSFETRDELEASFLTALLEQSTKLLTSGGAEQVTVAEAQLQQALLLTRSPERARERELAERLQGDVSYWRGAADVKRAVETLQLSAASFEGAATKRPRHSSDASAWAEHARYIAEEIDKGPRSLRADEAPKEEPHFGGLSAAPKATLAPVSGRDPENGVDVTAPISEAMPTDAGVPTVPPSDADVPPIDAALPRGGVLL